MTAETGQTKGVTMGDGDLIRERRALGMTDSEILTDLAEELADLRRLGDPLNDPLDTLRNFFGDMTITLPIGRAIGEIERLRLEIAGGVGLIAAERRRQIEEEGFDDAHDDAHGQGELARAAMVYASPYHLPTDRQYWPWRDESYKPKNRITDLVRAGALIAAEIDRLQR